MKNLLAFSLVFLTILPVSSVWAQDATQKLVTPSVDSKESPIQSENLGTDDSHNTDKILRFPGRKDDIQTEKILNSLAAQAGWFPNIKISVHDGMVILKGVAKDAEQLEWLAKTADRLPTVIAVINQATVETAPVTDLSPAWKEFKRLLEKAKRALPLLGLALLLLVAFALIGRPISRGIQTLWGRHIQNPFLLSTVSKITMLPIWVLFFYLALQTAGLSGLATTIIGGTGALGIVLGFAFKDIAENYLSGLLLAIRSPFTKGDEIEIDTYAGFVQNLNMRGTTIVDHEGNMVLIPNSKVIQSVIRNKSVNPNTRSYFIVGIGYDDSVAKAQELIYEVLRTIPEILKDPAPLVVAEELASSTVNLKVMFWYNCVTTSLYQIKGLALTRVKETLLANEIALPDDGREVVFSEPLKIQVLQTAEEATLQQQVKQQTQKTKAVTNLRDSQTPLTTQSGHERDVERMADQIDLLKKPKSGELLEK